MIKEEIISVLSEANIDYQILSKKDYRERYHFIVNKFANGDTAFPLWERIYNLESEQNEEVWTWVSSFVGTDELILFLDKGKEEFGVVFNGSNLDFLLRNTFQFVFYITNKAFSYMVCFNEHDFLIAAGTAKGWLSKIKASLNTNIPGTKI